MNRTPMKSNQEETNYDDDDDKDIISKLPQSIICHVLSRLPTRDAVRTSVLSKDWVNKWTIIYNVDFTDKKRLSKQRKANDTTNDTGFITFVEKMLTVAYILKGFRLVCFENHSFSHLTTWVSTALERKVETFELELYDQQGFVMPRSFVKNACSLRKLRLVRSCSFEVSLENYFPNLVYLYLDRVKVENWVSSSGTVVFDFPVLKTFELIRCEWSNVRLVEVHCPALRMFKCESDCYAGVRGYMIKICGARLAKFKYRGAFPENIIFDESVVDSATFEHELDSESNKEDNDFPSGLHVRKQLEGLTTLTELNVSASICEAIAESIQEVPLPQYARLQRIVMHVHGDAKLLLELLHCAPSLKFLEITGWCSKELAGDEVDHVPYCVISHLQEVKVYSTRDKSLMHLAEFFLRNGTKLRKISLDGYYSPKVETVEQLLEVPRASACIAIVSN